MLHWVDRKELTVSPVPGRPTDPGRDTSAVARHRLRASTRRLARAAGEPVLARLAGRASADALRETEHLRAEVEQLRAEVARLRTDMDAELALVRAEAAAAAR